MFFAPRGTALYAETNDLGLTVTTRDDRTVVSVSGEIDLATQGVLRAQLNELVVAGKVDIVIDLSEVDFVDSTGLGALIGTRRRVHAFHGSLTLVIPNEAVMKVFTITGLEKVFDIYPDLDAAFEA
jgi:anti-sigma B factor antagonist